MSALKCLAQSIFHLTYTTTQQVEFRDWRLGLIHKILVLAVVLYGVVYQIVGRHDHFKEKQLRGGSGLGASSMSDEVAMTQPGEYNASLYRCGVPIELSRTSNIPTKFIRYPVFSAVRRENGREVFLPTLIQRRAMGNCNGLGSTRPAGSRENNSCEAFQNTTYADMYSPGHDLSAFSWDMNDIVLDPERFVIVFSHRPLLMTQGQEVADIADDYFERRGFTSSRVHDAHSVEDGTARASFHKRVAKSTIWGVESTKVLIQACPSDANGQDNPRPSLANGKPCRRMSTQLDYMPLLTLLDLAGATTDCSYNGPQSKMQLQILSGFSLHISIQYKSRWEHWWDLSPSSHMDYEYHVQLVSNRTWSYDDDLAAQQALKIFGIRLTVEAGGVADVFDPSYLTGTFLPQFLALLLVADIILRTFIEYGHYVSFLATAVINCWSGILRLFCCRGFGAKKWKRWEGTRFIWYYRYLKLTTVNLAAVDFFLRSVERPQTEKRDDPTWIKLEWDNKCRKHCQPSALNASNAVLVHQITRAQLHKQLHKFERDIIKGRNEDGVSEWRKHVATGESLEMECFDDDERNNDERGESEWELCHAVSSSFEEASMNDAPREKSDSELARRSRIDVEVPRDLSNKAREMHQQSEHHFSEPDAAARGSCFFLSLFFRKIVQM